MLIIARKAVCNCQTLSTDPWQYTTKPWMPYTLLLSKMITRRMRHSGHCDFPRQCIFPLGIPLRGDTEHPTKQKKTQSSLWQLNSEPGPQLSLVHGGHWEILHPSWSLSFSWRQRLKSGDGVTAHWEPWVCLKWDVMSHLLLVGECWHCSGKQEVLVTVRAERWMRYAEEEPSPHSSGSLVLLSLLSS